ncbi:hypothetical protein IC220_04810 [Wolbachia endosymbiont of Pentalonia nigronervosa]|uniref:hypothetical protein n=1 Tax=Wolbachia endosymbiont of Pentalonia nigronervosa TaxID=1301914 RepID=UPI00165F0617|nr:hypothetical protein [Wolbachia endosymbiont of Pentalonia nigronervosa]MBD0391760.1 hypothetical protein [Wolbachia endosymbiont of Pentalonia nigronervosa]
MPPSNTQKDSYLRISDAPVDATIVNNKPVAGKPHVSTLSNDQYYHYNIASGNIAKYNSVKNSKILQNKTTIALALYNHPDSDTIVCTDKQGSEKTNDIQFKLKSLEFDENGYIAIIENGSQIITITGKTVFVVTSDFMNSEIKRAPDTRIGVNSGILGYKDGDQAIRFNVMVMLDAENGIDSLFQAAGNCNVLVSKIFSTARERGTSAVYPIGSKQKDYIQFVVSENTLQIVLRKKNAFIGAIHNAVVEVLGKVYGEEVEVNREKVWKLNLTQKDTFMSGAALNKARGVVRNTARIEVLARDPLEAKAEQPESEKVRRREYLKKKFDHAVNAFGKAGTRSNHKEVPKEQQLSIDLGNKPVFGIISKILHWIENKFKYFFPRYNLFPEVGNKDRKIPGTKSQVKYFTPEEQAEHTLDLNKGDGKLYNAKGELYDTTDKISKGKKGYVAYVITLDGRLITHEHVNVGKSNHAYRHSTLAGGEPVLCSGLMVVKNGKIKYIDNNSGHYKPRSANLYNAIERLKVVFAEDSKVVHFGGWFGFIKEIPILCRIVPGKKESIGGFQKRMEKKGKSGLTKVEKCFKEIREYNKQYEQKLLLGNYKLPTSEPPNNPAITSKFSSKLAKECHIEFLKEFDERSEVQKVTIEHSIRKIIGAKFGHKPRIEYAEKRVGINVIFSHEDDHEKFVKLLDCKGYHYTSLTIQEKIFSGGDNAPKSIVFMDERSFNKFIKNTLEIVGTVLSDLKPLPEKSCSRTI